MKQYVVTISRQFGSMGRMIAQQLSRELGVNFYDRDIVEETASRMGLPVSVISNTEENSKSIYFKQQYPLGMGIASMRDEIFLIQKNIIRDLAQKESCIIVGRCADSILMDMENHLNVYIYAPMDARLRNAVELAKLDEKTAKKMIREIDRSRELYHRRYCPEYVDPSTNKDIMIDSSRFGSEGTVKILAGLVRELFA
ncbi:MAG: cytidylate kinase-like family protein [Clostridiales bacterium]|nr:cytidylate kinase-like family protein [Clostridiales bacterium]